MFSLLFSNKCIHIKNILFNFLNVLMAPPVLLRTFQISLQLHKERLARASFYAFNPWLFSVLAVGEVLKSFRSEHV